MIDKSDHVRRTGILSQTRPVKLVRTIVCLKYLRQTVLEADNFAYQFYSPCLSFKDEVEEDKERITGHSKEYVCGCVRVRLCVCVCLREREKEIEREPFSLLVYSDFLAGRKKKLAKVIIVLLYFACLLRQKFRIMSYEILYLVCVCVFVCVCVCV